MLYIQVILSDPMYGQKVDECFSQASDQNIYMHTEGKEEKIQKTLLRNIILKKCIFGHAVVQVTLNCELQKISKHKI